MATATYISPAYEAPIKAIKPMYLVESLLLFGIPAIVLSISLFWFWPLLISAGISRPVAYTISLGMVNTGLAIAALVGYRLEGRSFTWMTFSQRMRLTKMTGRMWLLSIGGVLVYGMGALLVNSLASNIYRTFNFTIPDLGPGTLSIGLNILILIPNILGEELWWRGFILPRQELAFGKSTWLLHGALWACFHMFKWWAVPFMLITCQVIPFVAQKTKNTWPGIISHMVVNGVGVVLSALG